jgi:hypothetical protein
LHTISLHTDREGTEQRLAEIMQHCGQFRALRIPLAQPSAIRLLLPRLSAFHHLALHNLECSTDAPIRLLSAHCGQLRGLSLHGLIGVTPAALVVLLSSLPLLQELDLSYIRCLTADVLDAIGATCKNLRVIVMLLRREDAPPANSSALVSSLPALRDVYINGTQCLPSRTGCYVKVHRVYLGKPLSHWQMPYEHSLEFLHSAYENRQNNRNR